MNPSVYVPVRSLDSRLDTMGYATEFSAAFDLRAVRIEVEGEMIPLTTKLVLPVGGEALVGTGLCFDLTSGCPDFEVYNAELANEMRDDLREAGVVPFLLVSPRSGKGRKGLRLANTIGIIDGDYQNELLLAVYNGGRGPLEIEPMERIAQGVLMEAYHAGFYGVESFVPSQRKGGFGSSGRH